MKIQPVSYMPKTGMIYNNKIKSMRQDNKLQASDSVNFSGYDNVLKKMAGIKLDRESNVEEHFKKVMLEIWCDNNINKSKVFEEITDIYTKKGLRGMLMEFSNPYPQMNIKNIIKNFGDDISQTICERVDNSKAVKASENISSPIVKLINLGRHGLWNSMINNKKAPKDIHISFHSKSDYIELYVDKKGDLTIEQNYGDNMRFTSYYSLTGHKKKVVESYGDTKPEATYYNVDGTKNFLKNFIFGGTVVDAIY